MILFLYVFTLISCVSENEYDKEINVDIKNIDNYDTIVSIEYDIIGVPTILRYDGNSNLFIYDVAQNKIMHLNDNGSVLNEIGRPGSGPGEFWWVNNIIITNKSLFVIDKGQFLIHKYNYNGEFLSSLDFGELGFHYRLPPMSTAIIQSPDVVFEPFILSDDTLLFSSIHIEKEVDKIYEIRDWGGTQLAEVGEILEGSTFTMNPVNHRTAISNREIPPVDKSNAFPVADRANPDEIFLIYNAIPMIAKYNTDGKKLWSVEIPDLPEIDSVAVSYFETMEKLTPQSRILFQKYISGVSNNDGELFLGTNSNPTGFNSFWIHHFNQNGDLIQRYKIISDVNILPIFDIDFKNKRIFVVTEVGEVRAYEFK
ncbi:6-bladed beta-propeller [Rhodohalobacter sp.]|uniref:6-bladed beta-propeller n=1 Tax=Rhodohalobacter sp. TaxID=1974210 RepID=UPI0035635EF1